MLKDKAHVVNEAHVEHSVCLVEHNRAEGREVERTTLHQVLQAPRCANDKRGLAPERSYLWANICPAYSDHAAKAETLGEASKLVLYLHGKLSRRRHHEDALAGATQDLLDEWDEEGGCLACPRLGQADDVAPRESWLNGLVLDGCRRRVAVLGDIGHQALVDIEVGEGVLGDEDLHLLFDGNTAIDELRYLALGLAEGAWAALLPAATRERWRIPPAVPLIPASTTGALPGATTARIETTSISSATVRWTRRIIATRAATTMRTATT